MTYPKSGIVLKEVNCQIEAGQFVSIVGPSGCGKSTFLRLAAGLVAPTSGSLLVNNELPAKARIASERMAFVFQDPRLLPWRTVAANIGLPLEISGLSHSERMHRIKESLALVGLMEADARKQPRNLSGGMRMRVSLARALVTRPNLLLLDEPFAALDDVLRQQLNEELVRLWLDNRWTAIFITHNVAEAVFLSERIFVMSSRPGTIVSEVIVPFEYPRCADLRADPRFSTLCLQLSDMLRGIYRDGAR